MSHHSGNKTVTVPRDVLIRALTKARLLYIAGAKPERSRRRFGRRALGGVRGARMRPPGPDQLAWRRL